MNGNEIFLDGPDGGTRGAVHILIADENVRDIKAVSWQYFNSVKSVSFRVVQLEILLQMKLVAFRLKDKVHLRDMLDVGLIDQSWTTRLPAELAMRLQTLIDTPNG